MRFIIVSVVLPLLAVVVRNLQEAVASAAVRNTFVKVTTQVDGALGGDAFPQQPQLAVTDREGTVLTAFDGVVHAKLSQTHLPAYNANVEHNEQLRHQDSTNDNIFIFTAPVISGVATFDKLYINTAGLDYRLQFLLVDHSTLPLGESMDDTFSDAFHVGVGEAYHIAVLQHPAEAKGGWGFGVQPIVGIQDKGHNLVEDVNNEGNVSVFLRLRFHRQYSMDGVKNASCLAFCVTIIFVAPCLLYTQNGDPSRLLLLF
jgi:hypothetical protein